MCGSAFFQSKSLFTVSLFMFLIFIDPFVLLDYQHLDLGDSTPLCFALFANFITVGNSFL